MDDEQYEDYDDVPAGCAACGCLILLPLAFFWFVVIAFVMLWIVPLPG